MELELLGRIVQRWWLAFVAALLLGGLVGYAFAQSRTPVYRAGADVLVGPLSADSNVLRAAGQTAQTYAEMASAAATLEAVELTLSDPRVADAGVTAVASDVTRILKIRVTAEDPQLVAAVANAIADELGRVAQSEVDEVRIAGGSEDPNVYRVGEIRVLELATVPGEPISPNKQLITALGSIALMVAAAVGVIAFEYSRQTVRVVGDVERVLPGRVVGRIERSWDSLLSTDRIAVLRNEHGPTAVGLRGLSVDLVSQLTGASANKALVVSGLENRDRSGDVAINVAAALARTGRRVALIDANETTGEVRSRLSSSCERPAQPLVIAVDASARLALEGRHPEVGPGLLDLFSVKMDRLPEGDDLETALGDLGSVYDHVVLHTAPAFGSPNAVRWAAAAAGSVLVVNSDVASAQALERCAVTLSRAARHFIGIVFDERPPGQGRSRVLRRMFGGGARGVPAQRSATSAPPRPTAGDLNAPPERAVQGSGRG